MNLIDEFFLEANPNPERVGCPREDTIRLVATGKVPADHPARAHLAKCSECFAEFQSFRMEASESAGAEDMPWSGSNVSLPENSMAQASRSAILEPPPPPAPVMPPQADAALDYGVSPSVPKPPARQDSYSKVLDLSSKSERELTLPVGLFDLRLRLPTPQAEGTYRLFFAQGTNNLNAEFGTSGVSIREDDQMTLRVLVDLRQFRPGAASLTLVAALPEATEVYTIRLSEES